MENLQRYKKEIDVFLSEFLRSKQKSFEKVNPWGPDALQKIISIVSAGKTIRGSLVLYIHDLLGGNAAKDALLAAGAYELFQTGFIVHDDIMDHDILRRGKATIHVQYNNEGMAMCVGDILFFLAHELMGSLHSPLKIQSAVLRLSSQIYEEVGIAQMQDLSFGLQKTVPTKEQILELYKYKTARYSFSLPMMTGAILACADKQTISELEKLGEALGILFQIEDDRIGRTGNQQISGKMTGSDRREDKKTLARFYPTQQEVNTYKLEASKSLQKLKRVTDTSVLQELLAFVTARKR